MQIKIRTQQNTILYIVLPFDMNVIIFIIKKSKIFHK